MTQREKNARDYRGRRRFRRDAYPCRQGVLVVSRTSSKWRPPRERIFERAAYHAQNLLRASRFEFVRWILAAKKEAGLVGQAGSGKTSNWSKA